MSSGYSRSSRPMSIKDGSPVLGESAAGEHGSGVIDQDVDARLLVGDFGGHAFISGMRARSA